MPTQAHPDMDTDVRMRVGYNGDILITSLNCEISYEDFCAEIKDICKFDDQQPFTVKWVDEDGDPCTISSQVELDEAIRLYDLNKDSEINLHVFPNVPAAPGLPCVGEDRNMYRRGARRWRKLYRVNGHLFQAKRFSRKAVCEFCQDRIWGLGRQGFKCIQCKLLVHKRCHKLVKIQCGTTRQPLQVQREPSGEAPPPYTNNKRGQAPEHAHTDSNGDSTATTQIDIGKEELAIELPSNDNEASSAGDSRGVSLDDFNILRVIGRGSYAKVILVEQKRSKRLYAMKVIKKELVNDDEDIDWVQTEKHVFETATNYPFLVGLHSCFQSPSRLFFVIEFVNGGDLMFHMQRQRRLPEEHARFYSAEICLALNFLHTRGIVYRDLKLDNVLLDCDGHIKLTDYGMCKEGLWPGDYTSTFCGTPNYIAPEILRGEDYGLFNPVKWHIVGNVFSRRFQRYVTWQNWTGMERDIPNSSIHMSLVTGLSAGGQEFLTPELKATLMPSRLHFFMSTQSNQSCHNPFFVKTTNWSSKERDVTSLKILSVDWWALGVLTFEMLAGRSPFDVVGAAENPDQNTEDYLFQIILEKTIRIPRSLSVKAASVLKGFLNKNQKERLGCHPQSGFSDIQSHAFFRSIDWDMLQNKQISPPYKPQLKGERDLEHFDPAFTNEPVQLTPDDPKTIDKIDQSEFDGFEYVNPLLMSMEDCV